MNMLVDIPVTEPKETKKRDDQEFKDKGKREIHNFFFHLYLKNKLIWSTGIPRLPEQSAGST